jgi:hypothetical protein
LGGTARHQDRVTVFTLIVKEAQIIRALED